MQKKNFFVFYCFHESLHTYVHEQELTWMGAYIKGVNAIRLTRQNLSYI
jgi:hypothetical protein